MGAKKHRKNKQLPITDDVQRAVSKLFAKAERAAVLAALKRCRSGRDASRVQRAILAQSFRSLREVERLVEIVNGDRRELNRLVAGT